MPTNNPRITVMLKPDDYAVLATLSELQGVSKSSLLADVWAMACPVLLRVARLLQEAKNAQESLKHGIREASEAALLEIQPMADQVMINFDLFEEAIKGHIAEARSTGPAGVQSGGAAADQGTAGAPVPPSSNTGVRFPSKSKKSSARSGGKS